MKKTIVVPPKEVRWAHGREWKPGESYEIEVPDKPAKVEKKEGKQ